jgi:hypothetical protein
LAGREVRHLSSIDPGKMSDFFIGAHLGIATNENHPHRNIPVTKQ